MPVVRRIFHMIGVEGASLHRVKRTLDREGVPTPGGARHWNARTIRLFVLDDVYKPHTFEEVRALVTPEVAARLNRSVSYSVWWYNRVRARRTQVSQIEPEGRTYRKRSRYSVRDKSEWIAVPVPSAGIPREVVEAARKSVLSHRRPSKAGGRSWELSGSVMRCAFCGRAMQAHTPSFTKRSGEKGRIYYYRCENGLLYKDVCTNNKNIRADKAEPAVWGLVCGVLSDPEQLRADLEKMIELERDGARGDPDSEAKAWLARLAEADRKRARFQDMAAEGLIDFDELRAKLAALEEVRETARGELTALGAHRERLAELERDKDTLLERYAGIVPEALSTLTSEERNQLYKTLRLKVAAHLDGTLEVSGVFGKELDFGSKESTYRRP